MNSGRRQRTMGVLMLLLVVIMALMSSNTRSGYHCDAAFSSLATTTRTSTTSTIIPTSRSFVVQSPLTFVLHSPATIPVSSSSSSSSVLWMGKKAARAAGNARKSSDAAAERRAAKKPKDDVIEVNGVVLESLPNAMFRVAIDGAPDTQEPVLATISGKIRKNFVKILVGDVVTMELSPYDLTRGRITFRMKK